MNDDKKDGNAAEIVIEKPKKILQKRGPKPRIPYTCPKCSYSTTKKCEYEKHLRRKIPCNKKYDHEYVLEDNKKKLAELIEQFNVTPQLKVFVNQLTVIYEKIYNLVQIMKNFDNTLTEEEKILMDTQMENYYKFIKKL